MVWCIAFLCMTLPQSCGGMPHVGVLTSMSRTHKDLSFSSLPGKSRSSSTPSRVALKGDLDSSSDSFLFFSSQLVDHFSPRPASQFWKQRYFVNDTFFKRSSPSDSGDADVNHPVVFLCVGGEGPPLTPDVVVTGSVHCALAVEELAPKHNALVVALEHRFYGYSLPTKDLSTENLSVLSHRQAIEDIARFITFINQKFQLDDTKTKWVTFGGSYPGMMAGWARAKLPHLIHASVASSAPVQAIVDNAGYNAVVGEAIAEPLVGGSAECLKAVQDAFNELGNRLSCDPASVGEDLMVCNAAETLADRKNVSQLIDDLTLLFPAQSNDPLCTEDLCNIAKICEHMTTATTTTKAAANTAVARRALRQDQQTQSASYNQLVTLARALLVDPSSGCMEVNYALGVAGLADPSGSMPLSGDRSWIWQTCSEFGFYQTCSADAGCPFHPHGTLPWYGSLELSLELCADLFNISKDDVYVNVNQTNQITGGRDIQSTRIAFPNGGIDPWKAQGIFPPGPDDYEPAFMVPGASHHAWTHPSRPGDSPSLVKARAAISELVETWLSQ